MMKMKKIISLLLIFSMILSCTVSSFATSSDEIVVIDGNQYIIEREVTDTYSQAIVREISTNKIVENFTYDFEKDVLVDNITNQTVHSISKITENSIRLASNDDKYEYTHTERYDFTVAKYTVVALTAAIAAVAPGVSSKVIAAVVGTIIEDKVDSIYLTQECYSYEENNYHYSKRIITIYNESDDSICGGPWTTYRKFPLK